MRRWNGWGDESVTVSLPEPARRFLVDRLGEAKVLPDTPYPTVLARLPASALHAQHGIVTSHEERLRHARGQSIPDLLALRSGEVGRIPDGVAFPESGDVVRDLLRHAAHRNTIVIPYGGGTSVVGHITPTDDPRPVLTIDLGRMNRLLDLDAESQLATFGAGAPGPHVEAQLRAHGYMLGHFPQSFEYSTLGGWVATRSSGQQSLRYGRIEQLFAGGTVETPAGALPVPTFPASAAGPDLRELVLGSEGRLGVLTEVKVRVTPLPAVEQFFIAFFPDWERALQAVRASAQARIPLSMLRLSNARETEMQLLIAGHESRVRLLKRYLAWRGAGDGRCMLTFGVTGTKNQSGGARDDATALFREHGAVAAPASLGRAWAANRFRAPYLREALWQLGYIVDTLETAADWTRVPALIAAIETALDTALRDENEPVHAFTHLSHVYPQGSSCYTTFVFRMAADYAGTLARWRKLKAAASSAIGAGGGTITHQHGVGVDHLPYLPAEKSQLGLAGLQAFYRHFDPQSLMTPGKLFAP
jgi:alkyldihydroxyacetonephosphate synthase